MAHPPDALAFLREIRVAEFWRKQLGEMEYSQRDPDDLYRWYEAMELRGPEEIRAYVEERMGRHPTIPITGIVATAPHPSRDIVDVWLASHDKVRTVPYWTSAAALLVICLWIVPTLHGCQSVTQPNPPSAWLPQAATLMAGTMSGAPEPLSTPAQAPPTPFVGLASPSAATIAAQNGASVPRSTPLGALTGISNILQNAASNSVSTASVTPATPAPAAPPAAAASSFSTRSAQHN